MKLSVTAFRAQASAQRKILTSYQSQLNYGSCSQGKPPASKSDDVESGSAGDPYAGASGSTDTRDAVILVEEEEESLHSQGQSQPQTSTPVQAKVQSKVQPKAQAKVLAKAQAKGQTKSKSKFIRGEVTAATDEKATNNDPAPDTDKSSVKVSGKSRTKSNQRWMKLRTTVQLSSAIASTSQKSKPPLKREDSFLKRFSTRQVPETQETVDNGDETANGSQTQHEVNRRRRKKREELSRTVVNPDENFYLFWLLVVAACVLYNLWALIVRQSFPEFQKLGGFTWYAIDTLTDLVYVLDIMVQFRTGYLEQGLMVYNSKKLAVHYIKSRAFTLDTLSMMPLDLLQFNVGDNPILRFPRFLKIYRVYNYYYMVESRTVYPNLWRVVNLIHILLILAHWFGCFYYLISEAEGFKGGWVYPFRDGEYATLTRKYLGSLYWSTLTLTTIGDLPTPETDAEYLFTIVSYLIGVFIFATIVGQVGNVITNRNANRLEFERLLDGAKTYMRHHKVPGGMKRRVLRWYDYSWSRGRIQGGGDINTALGLLPDKLKTELALHVNLSVLKKVTIFQECQPEFLHDLVLKMKAYIFTPGDLICRKGEVAREMFIIADGILDVISENGRVLTTMNAGDFFGEIGILNLDGLNKRTADVRSVGYSELFSLSREDVLAAMKDYPEAQDILQTLGRKRLMEAKNASKIHKPTALKPAKPDLDSSGETEAAGKNIVEKLRSDVKGLRSVLRRSRKGTSAKETMELRKSPDEEKIAEKKPTPLVRMEHVQSSEEREEKSEPHSPVGAGLPLLQRLKLLKEKDHKLKSKTKESSIELQLLGSVASLLGKSKTAKPDDKPSSVAGPSGVKSTVRTQVRFDKATKSITITSPQSLVGSVSTETKQPASTKEKDSAEPAKHLTLEKFGLGHSKEKLSPAKSHQEPEKPTSASEEGDVQPSSSAASLVGEIDKAVPKLLEEVSKKSKEAWRLLKISSISSTKSGKKSKGGDSMKGEYLSKSDTVLEKQATVEQAKDEDKRSRSISPSLGLKESGDSTSDGGSIEDKRSRALGHIPRGDSMKKYDSISDLSPEHSGLPFVKKLEILNERQKMSKLEEEMDLRSASLEVQDPESPTYQRPLVRSQSEVGTMKTGGPDLMLPFGGFSFEEDGGSSMSKAMTVEDFRQTDPSSQSQAELTSPESNETFERQHLKSILKKLSAEECAILANQGGEKSTDVKDTAELKKLMRAPTVEGYAARHKKLTKSVTFDRETVLNPLATEIDFGSDTDSSDGEGSANPTSILSLQMFGLSVIPMAGTEVSDEEKTPDDKTDSNNKPDDQGDSGKKTDDKTDLSKKADDKTDLSKKADDKTDLSKKADDETDLVKKDDDEKDLVKKDEGEQEPETSHDTDIVEKADDKEVLSEGVEESSAASQDESVEYETQEVVLGKMISGIQESVQGLLVEVKQQFQARVDDLERKVKERDELIIELQARLFELNVRKRVEVLTKGPNGELIEILLPDTSDEPVTKEQQQPPADHEATVEEEKEGESSGVEEVIPVDEKGNIILKSETEVTPAVEEYMCQPSTSQGIVATEPLQQEDETTSDEEIEAFRQAAEDRVPPPISSFRERKYIKEYRAKRNYSVDDAEKYQKLRPQKSESGDWEFPSQFTLRRRKNVAKSQPIQVETESETESSDGEAPRNEDWEIQMLLEELEKEEIRKKALKQMERELEKELGEELGEELDEEEIEGVKQLQEELDSLKKIVQESDLSQLSASEYCMLEKILDEKDQKISQIAKSKSLDEDDTDKGTSKSLHDWDAKSDKGEGKKKSTLRRRLGQALSFDSHDIDRKRGKSDLSKRIKFSIKRKSISGSRSDKGSFYGLFRSSKKTGKKGEKESSAPVDTTSRVSLPALSTCEIEHEKVSDTRTSLPTLSSQHSTTFPECLTASVGSVDNVPAELEHSSDSVFEEVSGESVDLEMQMPSPRPSSSGLQGFFKTVGQKVKRAMSTEGSTVKPPVPLISIICEDTSPSKKGKETASVESGGVARGQKPEDESMGEDREGLDQEPQPGPSQV